MFNDERLAAGDGDVLIGADRIRDFCNTLLDPASAITTKHVYNWAAAGFLPTAKLGSYLTATKPRIRAALAGQLRPSTKSTTYRPPRTSRR